MDQTVLETWESILATPALNADSPMDIDATTLYLTACIQYLMGRWHAAVLLQVPKDLATRLTGLMFEGDPDAYVEDGEVRDAIGELTNVVAGNLRRLMPDGAMMSLPTVVEGISYSFSIMDASVVLETIKATGRGVRFGFVTSQGSPDMRKRAEEAGALFLIAKPFTHEMFERTLSRYLG